MFLPLTSLLLTLSLLPGPGLSSPARVVRQRLPKFKNFPIVGLKSTEPAEEDSPADLEEYRRDPRETEPLEDEFVEEAVFLTPADREQKALEESDLHSLFEDSGLADYDQSYKRTERDGGHHGHHQAGSHRSQPAQVEAEYEDEEDYSYDYNYNDYVEPQPAGRQQQRRGKQSGATGVALGVLSNPPSSDGNYNFK